MTKPASRHELTMLTELYGYTIAFVGPSRIFVNRPGVAGSVVRGFTDWTIEKWMDKLKP